MTHRIATDSAASEFRLLRNRIEADVRVPAVVLVTSATDRDGAELTAYGLAESLSRTHQRVALLTTAEPHQEIVTSREQPLRRRASDRITSGDSSSAKAGLSVISVSPERLSTISRSSIDELVQELRAHHDYVVVDAGDLPNNSFGLLLLPTSDAILIAFLTGRQQVPPDRTMLDSVERAETKVLGVVMNDQRTIDEFTAKEFKRKPGIETDVVVPDLPAAQPIGKRFEVALERTGKPA